MISLEWVSRVIRHMIFCLYSLVNSPCTILMRAVSASTEVLNSSFRALTLEPSEIFLKQFSMAEEVRVLLTSRVIWAGSILIHSALSFLAWLA